MRLVSLCEKILGLKLFESFFTGVILVAAVLVGLATVVRLAAQYGGILAVADIVVIALFTIEVVINLGTHGFRLKRYLSDNPWNVFDFTIVALSLFFLLPLPIDAGFVPVLRVLRLLRLLTKFRQLQLMVAVLIRSIGYLQWIGVLLILVFYVYAVMGVEFFREIDPENFGSIPITMLTLFMTITSGWSEFYLPLRAEKPIVATLYFVSFVLIGLGMLFNLVIGAIMKSVDEESEKTRIAEIIPGSLEEEMEIIKAALARIEVLQNSK